jgi:hypothetical protein
MSLDRSLLHLWDFGWLDFHDLKIDVPVSPEEFVARYLCSNAFGTSFVGPALDVMPDLHGPFRRSAVEASHFKMLSTAQLEAHLAEIRNIADFGAPPTLEQWTPVEDRILSMHRANAWTLALALDERDKEQFHDWGSILWLFREYVFATPGSCAAYRAVFGYD